MADELGAIDFAVNLLREGCAPRAIMKALRSLPVPTRRRGGLAARLAARDALAAKSSSEPVPNDTVAAMTEAYLKCVGRPD